MNKPPQLKTDGFEVTVTRSQTIPGAADLFITHNGYQWTTIRLLPLEVNAVINALSRYQDNSPKQP